MWVCVDKCRGLETPPSPEGHLGPRGLGGRGLGQPSPPPLWAQGSCPSASKSLRQQNPSAEVLNDEQMVLGRGWGVGGGGAEPWRGPGSLEQPCCPPGGKLRQGAPPHLCAQGGGYHPQRVSWFGHVALGRGQPGGGRRPGPSARSDSSRQWLGGRERVVFFFFSNRIKRRRESCWQEEGIGTKPRLGSP